jgi:predicted nucleotidyltransferase
MKLLLENMPAALQPHREALAKCIEGFNRARHVRAVYLFGSHARGEARADSDVDLCIVADGAEKQLEAARAFRKQIGDIYPCPALTLIPIAPARLEEKKAIGDFFFGTVLKEGILLATEN